MMPHNGLPWPGWACPAVLIAIWSGCVIMAEIIPLGGCYDRVGYDDQHGGGGGGGLLGLLLKKGIAQKFEAILMKALGLATAFIGLGGVLSYMLVVEEMA